MARKEDTEDPQEGRDEKGRFIEGNKFATLKGIFQSDEELREAIQEYFQASKLKTGVYKPTLTGLCFHLGFVSIQSFYDYEKDERYSYTIKRARLFIQSCYESNLYGFAWAGAFAALRNIGREFWKDEITENQNQTITQVTTTVVKSDTPLADKEE